MATASPLPQLLVVASNLQKLPTTIITTTTIIIPIN